MIQTDKQAYPQPTKLFPCDCMSEGLTVAIEEDSFFDDGQNSPYIGIGFWKNDDKLGKPDQLSYWERIKYAYRILIGKSPWYADMVTMNCSTARNMANHILYLIKKHNKSKE